MGNLIVHHCRKSTQREKIYEIPEVRRFLYQLIDETIFYRVSVCLIIFLKTWICIKIRCQVRNSIGSRQCAEGYFPILRFLRDVYSCFLEVLLAEHSVPLYLFSTFVLNFVFFQRSRISHVTYHDEIFVLDRVSVNLSPSLSLVLFKTVFIKVSSTKVKSERSFLQAQRYRRDRISSLGVFPAGETSV